MDTCAQDPDLADLGRGQVSGGNLSGNGGSDICEITLIQKNGLNPAGPSGKKQHQAGIGGKAQSRVLIKARSHFNDEIGITFDITVFDVGLSGGRFKEQLSYRRDHAFTLRIGYKAPFNTFGKVQVGKNRLDLFQGIN
jgi:hypothetical protein